MESAQDKWQVILIGPDGSRTILHRDRWESSAIAFATGYAECDTGEPINGVLVVTRINPESPESAHSSLGENEHAQPTELITWIAIEDEIPDEDITVLLSCRSQVWPGYCETAGDEFLWRWADGSRVREEDGLTHWAEFPMGAIELIEVLESKGGAE